LGDIYATPAFDLPAQHILHVVTIDLDQRRELPLPVLTHLFKRMLFRAGLHGTSVGLPLIGMGAAGLDVSVVVQSLVDAASVWLDLPTGLMEVTISTREHFRLVEEALAARFTDFVSLDPLIQHVEVCLPGFVVERPTPWELARMFWDSGDDVVLFDMMSPREFAGQKAIHDHLAIVMIPNGGRAVLARWRAR